jgi:hypothetical protein
MSRSWGVKEALKERGTEELSGMFVVEVPWSKG